MNDGLFVILLIAIVLAIITIAVVGLFLKDRAGNTPLILHSIIIGLAVILGIVGVFYYRGNVVKKTARRGFVGTDDMAEDEEYVTDEDLVAAPVATRRVVKKPAKEPFFVGRCRKYLANKGISCSNGRQT